MCIFKKYTKRKKEEKKRQKRQEKKGKKTRKEKTECRRTELRAPTNIRLQGSLDI